jgi:hypothetical protein
MPPNPPMQSTPLRVPKIVAILKLAFGPTALLVYHGGAADGQSVGRSFVAESRSHL